MTIRVFSKLIICVFALVFAALSFSASLHAMEYGDAPHEHEQDGVVCMITAVSEQAVFVLPPVPEEAPISDSFVPAPIAPPLSIVFARPQSRAPPARAPPSAL